MWGEKYEDYINMVNKVKSMIGYIKSQGGIIEVYEIDCSSNYLYFLIIINSTIILKTKNRYKINNNIVNVKVISLLYKSFEHLYI